MPLSLVLLVLLSTVKKCRIHKVTGWLFNQVNSDNCVIEYFNKVDIKELGLDDVYILKKHCERTGHGIWKKISELFTRKGNTFMCGSCHTVHTNMTSGFDHYEVDHADWKREKYFEKNSKIFSFLLLFLKDLTSKTIEEYNIYEEATEFLSVKMIKNAVYLEWSLLASYARITQEER